MASEFFMPYRKVYDYWNAPEVERTLGSVRDYLMCMPYAGGEIADDNRNPRVRLMKYLYHDGAHPLEQGLPTMEQRLKMVFNPEEPDKSPGDKGYRIFTQSIVSQAQLAGMTIMRVYIGRVIPVNAFTAQIGMIFEFLSNVSYESDTRSTALSRTYAMECAAVAALNGINIDGVGAFYFDRRTHSDCGSYAINDERQNVGRRLTMAFTSMTDRRNP